MLPFFIWLNYRGWLRADSLELVGLDISYHCGMHAIGQGGGVRQEYVDAFNRNKGNLRQRRGGNQRNSNGNGGSTEHGENSHSEPDPEMDQMAAAREAMEDDFSLRS